MKCRARVWVSGYLDVVVDAKDLDDVESKVLDVPLSYFTSDTLGDFDECQVEDAEEL